MSKKDLSIRTYRAFTRFSRFINQLMRARCFGETITVQQCYTLEALMEGKKSMKNLASQVSLHQSTLTRVVEKLEKQNFVRRCRKENDQRTVEVEISDLGKQTYSRLERQTLEMIPILMNGISEQGQIEIVEALETLAEILNPENEKFHSLLEGHKNVCKTKAIS